MMVKKLNSKLTKPKEKKGKAKLTQPSYIVFDMSQLEPNCDATETVNKGLAVAGKGGTARAGSAGAAIAGDGGNASAGQWGVAFAGEDGTATVGAQTIAVAGKGGRASGGDGAVAIVLQNKERPGNAEVGNGGLAYCERGGIARVSHSSVAVSLVNGKASADQASIIILGYIDDQVTTPETPATIRFQIGVIGEGKDIKVTLGLKPNTVYELDNNHNFIESHSQE